MPDNPSVWEIRLGIVATEQQADEIKQQITALLCPDPDHAPPCPVPWSVALYHESELGEDAPYETLVEQARAEGHLPAQSH
jgi:hypothetical protein